MADSDNTTTLPFVTRRRKKRIVVFNHSVPGGRAGARDVSEAGDPAIAAARLWRGAQARTLTLCRRQQRLETTLMRAVGSPLAAGAANEAEARAARWRHMDRELGYSRAKNAEERAAQVAEQLLEKLARTPAQSIGGVIAKLDVVLREGRTHDPSSGFPWAQLRSVLADLRRLCAEAEHASPSQASR
jgi:hypothetical protein